MARALGLPMVVGLGEEILDAAEGEPLVLDGDIGAAVLEPAEGRLDSALRAVHERRRTRRELASTRALPAITRDGTKIRLLCNASTGIEVEAGLAAGAEGVGLLRTELAFLEASGWPSEAAHLAALRPALEPLAGRTATVRTLDFGADKTPPFLAGVAERGLALSLAYPEGFEAQLKAIVAAGAETRLRVLLPLVESPGQLREARALLPAGVELGAMIETPEAAGRASEIASEADFISIGTNDLVQYTLGLDRERPVATVESAADPEVLGHIASVIDAAHARGLTVEVCGEAAGEPVLAALLVGLGVDELSIAPARVDAIRETVRSLYTQTAAAVAHSALTAGSAKHALELGREALLDEPRNQGREVVDGINGVVA
jgi:phosphoenolpyruvate-protein kinase (PTS system EI component)